MANIKISELTELSRAQLDDDDMFIVNDQNSTTTRLSLKTLTDKFEYDGRVFRGDVEFQGAVTVTGTVANRDIYSKSETLNEIDKKIEPVQFQLDNVEGDFNKMVTLTGQPRGAQTILGSSFIGGSQNMTQNGPYTLTKALRQLDVGYLANKSDIGDLQQTDLLMASRLDDLDMDSSGFPDGKVTVNRKDIAELKIAVGDLNTSVGQDGSNITGNTTYISNIVSQLGTSLTATQINTFLTGANYISAEGDFIATVVELDKQIFDTNTALTAVTDDLASANTAIGVNNTDMAQLVVAIRDTCSTFATSQPNGTAKELAEAIAAALVDLPTPPSP